MRPRAGWGGRSSPERLDLAQGHSAQVAAGAVRVIPLDDRVDAALERPQRYPVEALARLRRIELDQARLVFVLRERHQLDRKLARPAAAQTVHQPEHRA